MNAIACRKEFRYALSKIMNTDRKDIQKEFGIVVRDLRLQKNISQVKLAELGDFERTYISDLERGLKHPSLHTVIKIGIALDVEPSNIVSILMDRILLPKTKR